MHNEAVNSFKGSGNIMNHSSKLCYFFGHQSQSNQFMQLLKHMTPSEHGGTATKMLQTPARFGWQGSSAGHVRCERIIQSPVASQVSTTE